MEKQEFTTKWNWGAFVNPISFGVGNRAYLCLLTLIPVFNIVWIFIVGAKAESWALDNSENKYRDEEEFRKVMDTWKRGGFVQFIIVAVILAFEVVFMAFAFSIGIASIEHGYDTQTSYSQDYQDEDYDFGNY